MFHRIIFLLLIVSSLSCNFNRCADCFQSFSEHRLQELFNSNAARNSVNVHSNTRHSSHYKSENRMAVQVILEIFLTVCIVKYCFLSEVCRYDKNSASCYCFTSDVMYKRYKRLVYKYTHPDLLTRFCKVNLSNAKKLA